MLVGCPRWCLSLPNCYSKIFDRNIDNYVDGHVEDFQELILCACMVEIIRSFYNHRIWSVGNQSAKRYLMLIDKENKIYMLDNGDNLFTIGHIQFPYDVMCTSHLKDTLVDGELVIDNVDGSAKPQFLINDIITYNGENVSNKPFPDRLLFISQSIVDIRNEAIRKDRLKNTMEPFSVRSKPFFGLSAVNRLLSPEFLASVPHEVDGLIFVPEKDPYKSGECPCLLKWKENETVEFRLKIIVNSSKKDAVPEKTAQLFLNKMTTPYATMPYLPNLQEYDNKIISCSYKDKQWHFQRSRDDRPFPNSEKSAMETIDALKRSVTREALCELIKKQ